jgi:hypothetical protein
VKRHHASSSGPMLGSPLITATRSPLRLRRSAAIKSGSRPEANVLVPASSSTFAFVLMQQDYSFCLKESNTVWMALQSRDDDHANPCSRRLRKTPASSDAASATSKTRRSKRSLLGADAGIPFQYTSDPEIIEPGSMLHEPLCRWRSCNGRYLSRLGDLSAAF